MPKEIKETLELQVLRDPKETRDQREIKDEREMQVFQGRLVKLVLQEKMVRMVLRVTREIRDQLEPPEHLVG